MTQARNAGVEQNQETAGLLPQSTNTLFPDLLERAAAKRRGANSRHSSLALSRQANCFVSAYFDDLPYLAPTDLIQFWSSNRVKFGVLCDIALEYLSIPASTATVERVFSIAGDICDRKRNRMKPETLNMQTMIRFNKLYIS